MFWKRLQIKVRCKPKAMKIDVGKRTNCNAESRTIQSASFGREGSPGHHAQTLAPKKESNRHKDSLTIVTMRIESNEIEFMLSKETAQHASKYPERHFQEGADSLGCRATSRLECSPRGCTPN